MGNHQHEHDEHRHHHPDPRGHREAGGPDTEFLDLELSKVLYGEAEGITREAYRELLKDAAKRRLQERWGARIEALAQLAVDELIADAEASLAIEARIAQRNQTRRQVDQRIAEIIAQTTDATSRGSQGDG